MNDFLEACYRSPTILVRFVYFWFVFPVFCLLMRQEGPPWRHLTALEGEDSKEEGRHLRSCEGQAAEAKGFTYEKKKI